MSMAHVCPCQMMYDPEISFMSYAPMPTTCSAVVDDKQIHDEWRTKTHSKSSFLAHCVGHLLDIIKQIQCQISTV